jgi:hypothetical protein
VISPQALLVVAILLAAAIQYGLAWHVLGDIRRRRQTLRFGRVTWALVALCLPYIGPLLYVVLGVDEPPPAQDPIWMRQPRTRLGELLQFGAHRGPPTPRDEADWGEEIDWGDGFVIDEPEDRWTRG